MISKVIELWNNGSDDYFKDHINKLAEIEQNPEPAFPPKVRPLIKSCCPDLKGKNVCVPSSGDNIAAFAFYLLGANVTSCDIAERQIENARAIAVRKGWDINFVCSDSMSLNEIKDNYYDLVYTSNGVHVWISDLPLMYGNFFRILKRGGHYIFFETHPMLRPFDDSGTDIMIVKPYDDIGPYGDVPTYAWRMHDFINALAQAGFTIQQMDEFGSAPADHISYDYMYKSVEERVRDHGRLYDWKQNPWAALPNCFTFMAGKSPQMTP